jgi:hypothetical protein
MERIAAGIGKTAYSTTVGPVKRLFGQGQEVSDLMGEYNQASQGDIPSRIGEVTGDAAMLAGPAGYAGAALKLGKMAIPLQAMLRGGAGGAVSAGAHAVQDFGQMENPSLGSAGAEIALSGALPGLASLTGQFLKGSAPKVLQSAIKPPLNLRRQINKPQFDYALKEGIVTNFGGTEKMAENIVKKQSKYYDMQNKALEKSKVIVDANEAMNNALKDLNWKVRNQKIDVQDYTDALAAKDKALEDALFASENGVVDGKTALKLKSLADRKTDFTASDMMNKAAKGEKLLYKAYRENIDRQLSKNIGTIDPELSKKYLEAKKNIAALKSLEKAVGSATMRTANNFDPGLLDFQAMNVAGQMATGGGKLGSTALGLGGRRLLSTPGGANMLYGMGNQLTQPRPTMSQLFRSGVFND